MFFLVLLGYTTLLISSEHLHPCEDLISMSEEKLERIMWVRKQLKTVMPENAEVSASYVAIWKSTRGFALVGLLERPSQSGFGAWKIASYQLAAVRKGETKAMICEFPMDIGLSINEIWQEYALAIASSTDYGEGVDGEEYYFGLASEKLISVFGKTWSPKEGSKLGRLRAISDEIVDLVFEQPKNIEGIRKSLLDLKGLVQKKE